LYNAAVDVVIRERRGSCSLLQRALGIGYGRAARLIDFMAEDGVVGQYNGSQARDVLISLEEWESRQMDGGATTEASIPSRPGAPTTAATVIPQRRNRIAPEPEEPSDLEDEAEEYDEEDESDEEVADDEEWDDEATDEEASDDESDDDEFEEDEELEDDGSEEDESDDEWDEEESEEEEEDWVERKARVK
jgi:S-DNA-T family DNA segregation ATPase FtsK/SpoIIIE